MVQITALSNELSKEKDPHPKNSFSNEKKTETNVKMCRTISVKGRYGGEN